MLEHKIELDKITCRSGGIGRRARLRTVSLYEVEVRVLSSAQILIIIFKLIWKDPHVLTESI